MIVLTLSEEMIVNWVGLREPLRLTPLVLASCQHHLSCKSMPLNMGWDFKGLTGLTNQTYLELIQHVLKQMPFTGNGS